MKKFYTMISACLIFPALFVAADAAGASTGEQGVKELELIHYWHFNNTEMTDEDEVFTDFSLVEEGVITYPGTGDGYMDFRTHREADPVSDFNLRMGEEPAQGAVLRVRNPANTREMLIAAPSTGFENLVVTFATTRTSNGAQEQEFYYSPDNGATWVQVGDAYGIPELDPALDDYGYLHKVIDLSDHAAVNNNPELHFRILFVGEGADNTSGNNRFDNLTLDGTVVDTGNPATQLSITSVNEGEAIFVNEPFSITINTLDADGLPTPVDEDLEVSLSLASGSGSLGGNLGGTLAEGEMSLTIEGILYDVAEGGVSIMASANDLEAATSDEFEVDMRTYAVVLTSFPPGAGELSGAGDYAEGDEVTIAAEAGEDYAFSHWSLNDEEVSSDPEYSFTMPAEDQHFVAHFDVTAEIILVHYWHFNDQEMTGDEEVFSDFSMVGEGVITYPGEGDGYMDFRSHRESDPVSNFNLRLGQEPDQGAVLRARNPSIDRELLIAAPSTNFADLVVTFATTRTENGSQEQEFYFSPDAGDTWVLAKEAYTIPFLEDEEGIYLHVEIDLSGHPEVNDNPDLHFKVLFVGEGNDNPSGNNRFDNLSVDGRALSDDVSVTEPALNAPGMELYPNPAGDHFNIAVDEANMLIRIYEMSGRLVYQGSTQSGSLTLRTSRFSPGIHIIRAISAETGQSVSKRLVIP